VQANPAIQAEGFCDRTIVIASPRPRFRAFVVTTLTQLGYAHLMRLFLTIDTEYSAGLHRSLGIEGLQENFDRSIGGNTPNGAVGIAYQMDVLDRFGLKGVFFVDPMPALVFGIGAIRRIVEPIIARGHDVQLHIHTEWLEFASAPPVKGTGTHIKDFSANAQVALITYAIETLQAAGAARPVAFRAGNYGANDDTLRALTACGIRYDSSFAPGLAVSDCAITLAPSQTRPLVHCGVVEVPIGAISVGRGARRHAQITALSAREMVDAVRHAAAQGCDSFTIVSHSFELMNRKRTAVNHIVKRRFEQFCAHVARLPGVTSGTYQDMPPVVGPATIQPLLPANTIRTAMRVGEQAVSNWLYGRK
jgi:hypothetical protein